MGNFLTVLVGEPFIDEPCPRLEGEPWVVDFGRTVEILGVEVFELFGRLLPVLRRNNTTNQAQTGKGYSHSQKGHPNGHYPVSNAATF
jgi:hypothetical protein